MAVAVDASTPAAVHSATGNPPNATTSNTFSPPVGSQIWVLAAVNDVGSGTILTPTITDSLGSHLSWALVQDSSLNDSAGHPQATIWWAPCPAAQISMTVTVSAAGVATHRDIHLAPLVITGAADRPVGATGKGGGASGQTGTATYTSTVAGSMGFIVLADWDTSAAHPTLQSGCTEQNWTTLAAEMTAWNVRQTVAATAAGVSTTVGASAPSVQGRWAYVEILPKVAPPIVLPSEAVQRSFTW